MPSTTDLNDLELDKWQGSSLEPEQRRNRWRLAIAGVVILILAAAASVYYWRRPAPAALDVRTQTEQAIAPAPPAKPAAEPGDRMDLPPLEQTDDVVRALVARLSSHPKVAAWLTTDQLIRNFTVVVFNLAGGSTASSHLARLRPAERFQVLERGADLSIDPRGYRRYDSYADAIAALDARGAARLYATLKPRIQDAYRELGDPTGNFDPVLERAFTQLLETPVVDGSVALQSKTVAYEFADPRLQSLSAAQRQFLRMGPRNMRLIQAKLREMAPLLGISPRSASR